MGNIIHIKASSKIGPNLITVGDSGTTHRQKCRKGHKNHKIYGKGEWESLKCLKKLSGNSNNNRSMKLPQLQQCGKWTATNALNGLSPQTIKSNSRHSRQSETKGQQQNVNSCG